MEIKTSHIITSEILVNFILFMFYEKGENYKFTKSEITTLLKIFLPIIGTLRIHHLPNEFKDKKNFKVVMNRAESFGRKFFPELFFGIDGGTSVTFIKSLEAI